MPSDKERIESLEERIRQMEDLLLDLGKCIYVDSVNLDDLQRHYDKYFRELGLPPRSFLD